MAAWKKQFQVTDAGLNIPIATVQEFTVRALSISGPYMAVGAGIDATAGAFDPDFIALEPEKLRGTGERNGDTGDGRMVPLIGAAGRVIGLRVPAGERSSWIEISSATPF